MDVAVTVALCRTAAVPAADGPVAISS